MDSIVDLHEGTAIDPSGFLTGAWRRVAVRRLGRGERERLRGDGVEHLAYVIRGRGSLAIGGETAEVREGTGVTVLLGDEVTFVAAEEPLELFVVTLQA